MRQLEVAARPGRDAPPLGPDPAYELGDPSSEYRIWCMAAVFLPDVVAGAYDRAYPPVHNCQVERTR